MGDAGQPGDAAAAPVGPVLQAPALPELEGDLNDIVMSEGTSIELVAALKRAGLTAVADLELFKGENGGPLDWAQSAITHLQSIPGNEALANSLAHKVRRPI